MFSIRSSLRSAPFALLTAQLMWLAPVAAQTPNPAELAERLRIGIEAAAMAGDQSALEDTRVLAERALAAFPEDALLNHYMGYALYRMGMNAFETDPMAAISLLEQAEDFLSVSIELEPIAESHALMMSVLGGQIMDDASAMQIGPRIGGELSYAVSLGPNNPRVRLMEGLHAFHSPQAFGGGFELARDRLLEAADMFESDTASPPLPTWGHAETYAWLGQTYERLDQDAEARAAYEKALEISPQFAWVRDTLLPGVRQ